MITYIKTPHKVQGFLGLPLTMLYTCIFNLLLYLSVIYDLSKLNVSVIVKIPNRMKVRNHCFQIVNTFNLHWFITQVPDRLSMGPEDDQPSGLMTPPDDSEEQIANSPAHAMMNVPDRIIIGGKCKLFIFYDWSNVSRSTERNGTSRRLNKILYHISFH